MPHSVDFMSYDVILAFEYLIFVFYFDKTKGAEIWCLDILSNGWYKCDWNVPDRFCISTGLKINVYVIKTKSNNIHILDFHYGHHFKANLYDLIPRNVIKFHYLFYKPLVMGYIKQEENYKMIPSIPFVIKKLISIYFPLFV